MDRGYAVEQSQSLNKVQKNPLRSLLRFLTTWFLLAGFFEKSALYKHFPLHPRWELLIEKINAKRGKAFRTLPGGFIVRKNRPDLNVLISMPFEYSIIEKNFSGRLMNIVDVGANIGAFAIYLNSFLKINKYVGLEPSQENFSILKRNLQLLRVAFTAEQSAASDESKEWRFDSKALAGRISQAEWGGRW